MLKLRRKSSSQYQKDQNEIFKFILKSNKHPKSKGSSFININGKEKQQILTFKKLKTKNKYLTTLLKK